MTQTARPISDVTVDSWAPAPLWSKVNDVSDSTWIYGPGGATTQCEVKLGSLTDPVSSSGHVIYVRAMVQSGSGAYEGLTWYLYQGSTLKATSAEVAVSRTTKTTYSYTLTGTQADSLTDYSDLRVRLAQTAIGVEERINVYDVWMECPDAVANAEVTPSTVTVVAAVPGPTVMGDANPALTTVAATTTVTTPTVAAIQNQNVTPTTVAAVAAIPDATAGTGCSASPDTVVAVVAIDIPDIAGNASPTPATVAAVAAIAGPTVEVEAGETDVYPATLAMAVVIETPTLTGDANVTPATVAATASISVPEVAIDVTNVYPATVAVVVSIALPTVSTPDAVVYPATVAAVAAIGSPTVAVVTNVYPATVAVAAAISAPTVTGGANVSPSTVVVIAAVSPPSVTAVKAPTIWAINLYDLDRVSVLANAPVRGARFTWVLDGPGAFEADLDWDDASRADWARGQRIIEVVRNNVVVWGGYLWAVTGDARARTVTASGEGYFSRLRHRVVTKDLSYSDIAQETIAWGLIDHTQGQTDGALGFTQGIHVGASVKRDRDYCARESPNIGDEIANLASGFLDGFDYEINPATKAFNTWCPSRGTAKTINLTGSDELTLSWDEDATEAASYVTAIGAGECEQPTSEVDDDTAIVMFDRLQETVDADTDDATEVLSVANEMLRQRKLGLFRATIAWDDEFGPAWGTYGVGDTLTVTVADGFATFTQTFRIVELSAQLETPTQAYVEATLDAAA